MKLSRRIAQRLIQLGILAAVLAVWYLVTLPGRINPLLLPAPLPVFADFGALVTTRGIWADLFITVSEWVVAFTIAAVAACVIGYFVSRSAYAVAVFDPLFAGLYSVPAILLFPLYLLVFRPRSGFEDRVGNDDRVLSDRAQHDRGPELRRPVLCHGGAVDGRERHAALLDRSCCRRRSR